MFHFYQAMGSFFVKSLSSGYIHPLAILWTTFYYVPRRYHSKTNGKEASGDFFQGCQGAGQEDQELTKVAWWKHQEALLQVASMRGVEDQGSSTSACLQQQGVANSIDGYFHPQFEANYNQTTMKMNF